jgi:hypothetical protein
MQTVGLRHHAPVAASSLHFSGFTVKNFLRVRVALHPPPGKWTRAERAVTRAQPFKRTTIQSLVRSEQARFRKVLD